MNAPSFGNLPLELYPAITAHLPLHSCPRTVLALALTSRNLFDIVYPTLLYSTVVLDNESDALGFMYRLLEDPHLGSCVREIHIMSELSDAARNGPLDVVSGLKKIIEAGILPHVHALGLHLLKGWNYCYDAVTEHYFRVANAKLGETFWLSLKDNCPRLRSVSVSGLGADSDDNGDDDGDDDGERCWTDHTRMFQIQDMTTFRLALRCYISGRDVKGLFKHIAKISHQLHTLQLSSASELFALTLPNLRSLRLEDYSTCDVAEATKFWVRHPGIENLSLPPPYYHWFADDFPTGLLPNLRHLEATFKDVRTLAPLLNQLLSLTVVSTINAQIPYLVRSVIPGGLPHLRSLAIYQKPTRGGNEIKKEGGRWYEADDGEFHQHKPHQALRYIDKMYMACLAKAVPSLEEIGLYSRFEAEFRIDGIIDYFSEFKSLKRVYFSGPKRSDGDEKYPSAEISEEDREVFLSEAWQLAEACPLLESLTDVDDSARPFLTAKIFRNSDATVANVLERRGFGMQIGREDYAFHPETL